MYLMGDHTYRPVADVFFATKRICSIPYPGEDKASLSETLFRGEKMYPVIKRRDPHCPVFPKGLHCDIEHMLLQVGQTYFSILPPILQIF
jgi:hypothetical protein